MTVSSNASGRLGAVDAMRGFALAGLFLVHIMESYELYWAHPVANPLTDAVFLLFMGKSFSLLAMCFGFSFHILMAGAAKRGEDFRLRFAWRLLLLAAIGYLHSLIYRGDIMVTLAALGMALIPAERIRSNRTLFAIAAVCFLGPTLIVQMLGAMAGADWANREALSSTDPAMAIYLNGSWDATLRVNLWTAQVPKFAYFIEFGRLPQIYGLFLIGMLLGRTRFFGRLHELRKQRWIALAVAVAFALLLQFGREPARLAFAAEGYSPAAQRAFHTLTGTWLELAGSAVWGLLVLEAYQRAGRLLAPLVAMGRLTLTLYVAQSIVFVPLFYSFGMGLHDDLDSEARLWLGLGGIAVQMAFATLWLRYFAYGPLEWAWRALTYLRADIPFRKREAAGRPAGGSKPQTV